MPDVHDHEAVGSHAHAGPSPGVGFVPDQAAGLAAALAQLGNDPNNLPGVLASYPGLQAEIIAHAHPAFGNARVAAALSDNAPTPEAQRARATSAPASSRPTARAPAVAPAPAEANDVVLTDDQSMATAPMVNRYSNMLTTWFKKWGQELPAGVVRVAQLGSTPGPVMDASAAITSERPAVVALPSQLGLVLRWDAAWGSQPTAPITDSFFNPIVAQIALTALHQLPGWALLPVASQTRLDALIGGATNGLSSATRRHAQQGLVALMAQDAAAQAGVLEGLVGAVETLPGLVQERFAGQPTTVTLGAATEDPAYAFYGRAAPALVYDATFGDGSSLKVVAPKTPDATKIMISVQEAADAARYLPLASRKLITKIVLNIVQNPLDALWAVTYNTPNFRSYMTAGADGIVTIYPTVNKQSNDVLRGSMAHETGHAWGFRTFGNDVTAGRWPEWQAAMDSDKARVSKYATNSITEDVAESMQTYVATRGSTAYEEYKAIVPARFKIFEAELPMTANAPAATTNAGPT